MHHHTENESSLFGLCLLSLTLSDSLCLCLSLCLSPCGVVVVLLLWVVVCVVWCVVCVHSTRPRVYVQNVPVYAGTTHTC